MAFYDGPNPPSGIFESFLKMPFLSKDVKTRDYLSLVQSSQAGLSGNHR